METGNYIKELSKVFILKLINLVCWITFTHMWYCLENTRDLPNPAYTFQYEMKNLTIIDAAAITIRTTLKYVKLPMLIQVF